MNVTALGAAELSFLTIWAGGDRPLAASLNPAPEAPPVPNAVTTQLSVDQQFEIYNNAGSVDVVVDVNGYYANHNHDDLYAPKGQSYTRAESYTRAVSAGLRSRRRDFQGRSPARSEFTASSRCFRMVCVRRS